MRKAKIIVNPNANLGRAVQRAARLKPIADEFEGVDWAGTVYPRHAISLAHQAAEQGYERVIAVGGDGTAHEVLNGLMKIPHDGRPVMGLVPLGSGNDFSHMVGASPNPEQALRQALTNDSHRIDIATIESNDGQREFWGNTLGIGFDATVTIRSRNVTMVKGFLIYLVAVMQTIAFNHSAPLIEVQTDEEIFSQEFLMLVLCNGGREGGGFNVQPEARPDDGLLNYVGVKRISRVRMLRLVPEVMKGTHGRFSEVRMGTFKQLELKTDFPLTIHIDGEIYSGMDSQVNQLKIGLLSKELQVAS